MFEKIDKFLSKINEDVQEGLGLLSGIESTYEKSDIDNFKKYYNPLMEIYSTYSRYYYEEYYDEDGENFEVDIDYLLKHFTADKKQTKNLIDNLKEIVKELELKYSEKENQ